MVLSGLDKLYWAAGFAGHLVLLLILFYRKYSKPFPVFTSLIALAVLRTALLLLIRIFGTRAEYFYTFWACAAVDLVLQLGVVYEIATKVFRPLGYWALDVRKQAIRWTLVSIAVSLFLTWLPRPTVKFWYQTLILKGSFFSSAVECALFVGLAVLSWKGGFPWNSAVARIAVGFVLFAFPDMVVEIGTTRFGLRDSDAFYQNLERARMTAYLCSLLFWNIALWMKLPTPRLMNALMADQLDAINESVSTGIRTFRPERRPQ